jgi:hypothetical protein
MIISLFMETPMCCRSDHPAGVRVEQARRTRGHQPDGQRQPQGFDHGRNENQKAKSYQPSAISKLCLED